MVFIFVEYLRRLVAILHSVVACGEERGGARRGRGCFFFAVGGEETKELQEKRLDVVASSARAS